MWSITTRANSAYRGHVPLVPTMPHYPLLSSTPAPSALIHRCTICMVSVWDAFALNRPLNLRSRIGSVVGRFKVAVLKGQQIKLINFVSYSKFHEYHSLEDYCFLGLMSREKAWNLSFQSLIFLIKEPSNFFEKYQYRTRDYIVNLNYLT